jgi:tRNA (mo5U34)-methyltransferase
MSKRSKKANQAQAPPSVDELDINWEPIPDVTDSEQEVADLLPIDASADEARAALERVPLWFHTFLLSRRAGIYAPGVARDHRYRIPALPETFEGLRVLDVGTFDGFYAFLAEHRGAERVLAIDNEQYVHWAEARWGRHLEGGEGFRTIAQLLGSRVEYRLQDALELDQLGERFDFAFCFGILHRVENPLGLLRTLRGTLDASGRVLVETHGCDEGDASPSLHVFQHGDVYAGDNFIYWGFTPESLRRLGTLAGFGSFDLIDAPVIDGHPRLIGVLNGDTA